MELRDRVAEEFDKRKEGLLIFAFLLGFGFFINQGVEIKGLYMDDLYLWSCYGEQSFREFVFPMGSSRFRFIFYLASWLELFFLENHVTWIVPFNIILNSLISFSVYRIAVRMSKRKLVSLAAAVAYLLSRMSYYQIGQLYGLMESLGLWAALGILYFLYRYVNGKNTRAFLMANLLYFLASFIHERYMVLFPVLVLGLLFGAKERFPMEADDEFKAEREQSEFKGGRRVGKSRRRDQADHAASKWPLFFLSAGLFGLIQVIRLFTIGTLAPAGTGGTDVADTFKMADAVGQAWEQVAFVFGRNSGPDYLCIQTYADSPWNIRMLIMGTNVVLAAAVLIFLVRMLFDRGMALAHLKTIVLFLVFIALCIGSSSVTIRIEMRWVYVAYGAALLLLSYMSSIMGKAGILVFLYVGLLFPVETYYRSYWDNLYLWPGQMRYNSLAEETYEKYGEEIFDKQVYIIGNTYDMSEFTAETFLKVYDKNKKGKNTKIQFIDSDFDMKEIDEGMVILSEDPGNNAFQDVTGFLKKQRINRAYGSYDDNWIDEHAKIVFMNGDRDTVILGCYYPGTITGDQVCQIRVNGKRMPDLVFTDNYMVYEIPSAPYQMVSLEFSCNFYVANAQEKRGEENLAMVVTIKEE